MESRHQQWCEFLEASSKKKGVNPMTMRDEIDKLSTRLLRYSTDAERWAQHDELYEIADFFRGRASAFKQASQFINAVLKHYPKPKPKEDD